MTDAMDRLRAESFTAHVSAERVPVVPVDVAEAIVSDLEAKLARLTGEIECNVDLIDAQDRAVARLTEEVQVGAEVIAGLTRENERLKAAASTAVTAMGEVTSDDRLKFPAAFRYAWRELTAALAGEAEEGTA